VGEASDGSEVIGLSRRLKPDIVLLDLLMRTHGLKVLEDLALGATSEGLKVIVLTGTADKNQIVEALRLGARGVVLKHSATQVLVECIDAVMHDQFWVGLETVSDLVQYSTGLVRASQEEARKRRFGLTNRELEIVSAIVAGFSNGAIASHFTIRLDTVKHHLSNIYDKLGVSTRLELSTFARSNKLPLPRIL
jgi:DNA-binding NarL/FixJ family response regulator